jgi:hypothetical protein
MTNASEPTPDPTPAPQSAPQPQLPRTANRPVVLAAILGGLLGAAFSLVLARTFPGVPVPPPKPAPTEATEFGLFVLRQLQAQKYEEIATVPLVGATDGAGAWLDAMKKMVKESREYCAATFGRPNGEFELMREVQYGPSVTRLVILEKFPKGGVVWAMGLYRAADGWALITLNFELLEKAYPRLP